MLQVLRYPFKTVPEFEIKMPHSARLQKVGWDAEGETHYLEALADVEHEVVSRKFRLVVPGELVDYEFYELDEIPTPQFNHHYSFNLYEVK